MLNGLDTITSAKVHNAFAEHAISWIQRRRRAGDGKVPDFDTHGIKIFFLSAEVIKF
jgi:hypothetical protein